jgi:uncharacterized protein (DUF362 family)
MQQPLSRREFVKASALVSAALAAGPSALLAQETRPLTDVWIFEGADNRALMQRCMETIFANGGFGPRVKTVALKVNAAWDRTPEQAANTHPDLVDVFLEKAVASGVKVTIAENPCNRAAKTFVSSGIQEVAKKHKVDLVALGKDDYVETAIPGGQALKIERVGRIFLEADAVVNMPIAKHHGSATLTICMKNWMGAVEGRRNWHGNNLHQCIADFATLIKPTWSIVDATACMTSGGPQGPSKDMIYPQQLILSKDQVAADTVAAKLFHQDPLAAVKYLAIARDMGIGETDLTRMNLHTIKV